MQDKKNNSSHLNVWILIAIVLFGFVLYFLPLQSKTFYFDDHFSIENNEAIKTIDIPRIFNAFNTRFLVGLSFALNYSWCGLHPAGYRLTNLLIHCLNAFLVYLLIRYTLYLYTTTKQTLFCRLEWPAFFASILFLCHPLQTEPVNFITQRFVLIGTLFYLLTLFLYIQYRCRFKKRYLIASFASAIAAMFCKEFVVTLPFAIVLYEFYFLNASAEPWWKRCNRMLPFFVIVLIVPLLLLRTPPEAVGVANIADSDSTQEESFQKAGSHIDITRAHNGMGRKQYFLTELNVVCTYVRLLFLPIHQDLDYDYPIPHGMNNKTALCGVFLLCLLGLAVITYKSYRLVSFGILWFFIALSVESSFIPIGHVIAEYRVYLATVGFVFLMTSLVYIRQVDVKRLNMIAAIILIVFSILTYQRNKIWKDEFTLWDNTVHESPHKARPYYNRGLVYYNQGNLKEAISNFTKAIIINHTYAVAYYGRASAYYNQGNFTKAISDYTEAIELNPKIAVAYNNRGAIYGQQAHFTQAISDLTKAIEIEPNYAEAYDNRGRVYYKQHQLTQALSDYNRAIKIDPKRAETFINRGIFYDNQGNSSQAISDFTKAIELNPKLAEAYNNRGNTYDNQDNLPQAIADFTKAIELNPKLAEAYNNRGSTYAQQGNLNQAIADFTKTIELNPEFGETYNNRGTTYGQQGHLPQAIADFTKAIEINPKFAKLYFNRGIVYYGQGNLSQSISDYSKAIELNPKFAEAYNNRGNTYDNQGNLSQGISDYTKAIELNPNYADAYDNRGIDYFNENNLPKAIADFTKAIEINPKSGECYNNRGFAYFKMKEYDKAWADVNEAEELNYAVNPALISALKKASAPIPAIHRSSKE